MAVTVAADSTSNKEAKSQGKDQGGLLLEWWRSSSPQTFRIEVGSKQALSLAGWVHLVVEAEGVGVWLT